MLVKLTSFYPVPGGQLGNVVDLPEQEARDLIEGRGAVPFEEAESDGDSDEESEDSGQTEDAGGGPGAGGGGENQPPATPPKPAAGKGRSGGAKKK